MLDFSDRTLIKELPDKIGQTVTIYAQLHKKRLLGKINFIILRDFTGLVQIVDETGLANNLKNSYNGTVIKVVGKVKEEIKALGGVEIYEITELNVINDVCEVAPIEIDKNIDHNSENFATLFDNRVLNLRNPKEAEIFKFGSILEQLIREYFMGLDFTFVHTPKIIAQATEGGAEVFKVNYYDQEAVLAQSPQFYKQSLVGVFERVFEIGAVYRAEPSMTVRHLSEYISIDAEIGYLAGLDDLFTYLEELFAFLGQRFEDLGIYQKFQNYQIKPLNIPKKFPTLTVQDLHQKYFDFSGEDFRKEPDPSPSEERFASDYAIKEFNSDFIFITEFPSYDMKFYHKKDPDNPDVALRADLIFRGVEIATVTIREERYQMLLNQLKEKGLNSQDPGFASYLQAFQFGLPPHGGFGMGLERLIQKMLGLNSVKEASLFVRDLHRIKP